MKNNLIFGILLTFSLLLSCKSDKKSHDEHDHKGYDQHKIALLPYHLNKKYFDAFKTKKNWKSYCSTDSTKNFIALYISESKRKIFQQDTIIYVATNFKSRSNTLQKMIVDNDGSPVEVESSDQPTLGRFGCNYFLTTDDDSDNQFLPGNNNKHKKCKLDSFMIGNKVYIHLLDVPHPNGVAPTKITKFVNYEFPISKQDYIKLDSLIKVHNIVGSGYDNENKNILNIKVDGDTTTIFSIKKNVKYYDIPNINHLIRLNTSQ